MGPSQAMWSQSVGNKGHAEMREYPWGRLGLAGPQTSMHSFLIARRDFIETAATCGVRILEVSWPRAICGLSGV